MSNPYQGLVDRAGLFSGWLADSCRTIGHPTPYTLPRYPPRSSLTRGLPACPPASLDRVVFLLLLLLLLLLNAWRVCPGGPSLAAGCWPLVRRASA